jgi:RNA-dependent RNA polymerase
MDFGFMFDKSTMMTMCGITRRQHIGIIFELNLLRKLIDVQFQLDISLPTDRSKEERPTSNRNKIEQYRFRIPLAQLQRVHTIQDKNSCALIISLDTPPNYYRKMHQLEVSHEEDSRYWTEWDCWFRQTDIVHDHRSLATAALALKKVMPIIDIGMTLFMLDALHRIFS